MIHLKIFILICSYSLHCFLATTSLVMAIFMSFTTVVSSQTKANMIYLVKDVAIYKADQIICLRVPVRVLCIAMEVAILNSCACTYFKHYCSVMYSIVRLLTVNPSSFTLVGEVARLRQKVGPEVGKAGDITDIPNSVSLHSALLVRWPD